MPVMVPIKRCTRCGVWRPQTRFGLDKARPDGLACQCNRCRRAYYKAHEADYKRRNRKHYRRHAEKYKAKDGAESRTIVGRARRDVAHAKATGRLIAQPCEDCGNMTPRQQAHHEDYNNPLVVIWLCGPCHWKRHHPEAVAEDSYSIA